jgi:dTDP-4-amino-4,6-dideoxygalactose transaminase
MLDLKSINDLGRHVHPVQEQLSMAIQRVLSSGWFVLGPEVGAFEREFADYCGVPNCVSVANGTDALELALRALDIGPGKTVLTVANAGMYSTIAILAVGATPLYAEVRPDTLLIDAAEVERILACRRVDALIVTHLYGLMADTQRLVKVAHEYAVPVIEDCAQAHGAVQDGRRAGSWGDIACFSFYPTKNLGALGDGGAVVTAQSPLADKLRQFRQYGWSGKYHAELPGGRNSRLDEMQAAVLRVMLPQLDQWNSRRREIAARYSSGIAHPKIIVPSLHDASNVAHLYVIRTSERDRLKQHLAEVGIPSDIHYPIPDFAQVACRHVSADVELPVTVRACGEVLTLPCFPELTDEEVDLIIGRINAW